MVFLPTAPPKMAVERSSSSRVCPLAWMIFFLLLALAAAEDEEEDFLVEVDAFFFFFFFGFSAGAAAGDKTIVKGGETRRGNRRKSCKSRQKAEDLQSFISINADGGFYFLLFVLCRKRRIMCRQH